ncbi:energy transducer TonB [Thermodesulfobacteriota bacterium]
MKRLLISAILALGVHATILGTECAWLKQIPVTGPKPGAMTISLGLLQSPGPQKTAVPLKPDIPLNKPVRSKTSPQKPKTPPTEPKPLKTVKDSAQPAQAEIAKTVNTQILPPEFQQTNSHTDYESIDQNGENIPAAHVIQKARPFYRKHPAPKYPRIARIRGYQGNVVLEVLVDRNGNVADLSVLNSSGYPILDKAAEAAVKNWSFEPGLIGNEKIEMWVRIPIRFELK